MDVTITIVEVKGFGDFDIRYTDSVWVYIGKITLPDTDYSNTRDFEKVYRELKSLGFKRWNTKSITIGGNL